MQAAWFIGCMLTGIVIATIAAVTALLLWAILNPKKNAELEMGFVAILILMPVVGLIVGAFSGAMFAGVRPDLASQAGRPFLLLAWLPGIWTVFWVFNLVSGLLLSLQWANFWERLWQASIRIDGLLFLLLPAATTVGLIWCGRTILLVR
jgi:hypothetical protein